MYAVIFDIDGTLADIGHRIHFIRRPADAVTWKKDWKSFHAREQLLKDTPIEPIVRLLLTLREHNKIVLCSGRNEWTRGTTAQWLSYNGIPYDRLYMRSSGDYRDDAIVKSELLDAILADGFDPWIVFDDRQRVVDMWRSRGLRCCQVAPGNF